MTVCSPAAGLHAFTTSAKDAACALFIAADDYSSRGFVNSRTPLDASMYAVGRSRDSQISPYTEGVAETAADNG